METQDTIRYIATGSKPIYLRRFVLYYDIFTPDSAIFPYFLTFRSLPRATIAIETTFFVIYPFIHIYLTFNLLPADPSALWSRVTPLRWSDNAARAYLIPYSIELERVNPLNDDYMWVFLQRAVC